MERPAQPYPEIAWSGWGDPAEAKPLSPELRELVRGALGIHGSDQGTPPVDRLQPAAPQLPPAVYEQLAGCVGPENVLTDAEARVRHTRGKSTPDLLKLRAGDLAGAPDAIVLPAGHDEVLAVLAVCCRARVGVVPFGGGTSVVGGLEPDRNGVVAIIALDLRRMNALVELDETSRTATLEPGLRGPEAETLLAGHGYTLGHFPQSFQYATLGGFGAARSSGQASAGYGRFDERVVGLRVATPRGTLSLGTAPKTAAGPDLRQLFLGSEGAFGVITQLTVEVRPVPPVREYEGWRFADFPTGMTALRRLIQDGPVPTVLRLSDEVETALNLARPEEIGTGSGAGCLAIVGHEGTAEDVTARRTGTAARLEDLGGTREPAAGPAWEHGRYSAPYLRDSLLTAGALVETLETAGFWSRIPRLYDAVREAITTTLSDEGTPPLVLCHVSHVYRSGASLYFTVACAQGEDPIGRWQRTKVAASDAILAAGGSITHHHGVGTDHRPWYEQEVGALGVAALQAVKRELDPDRILNPGVLLP
jgi:alkyldihydroxyacetonephosphate synthase